MGNIFLETVPDSVIRMHDDGVGNYWFYHKESFQHQEPLLYKLLIDNAKSYIEIWDPHFNVDPPLNRDHDIFEDILPNITIKILTLKHIDRQSTYLADVYNAIKGKIPPNKNVRFGMKIFNTSDKYNYGGWFFHDRFLIIDQKELYLIGGSVGWHITPMASTGIFRINDQDTILFIQSLFDQYWLNASHEWPLCYL